MYAVQFLNSLPKFPVCLYVNQPVLLHRAEIEKCLDISYLIPYLCSSDLIDLHSEVADDGIERRRRIKCLINVVVEGGDLAYGRFVKALKDSGDEHMGHQYLASLLEGRSYGTDEVVEASKSVETRIRECMTEVLKSLNGSEMLAYLMQQQLLTPDEHEKLISATMTTNSRNLDILKIIGRKGPTAHYHFAECIKRSCKTVPEHESLFKLISSNLPTKFKADEQGSATGSSIIRTPCKIELEGILASTKYYRIVKQLRLLYLEGKFDEAERIVDMSKVHNSTELDVALLLESCTAFITMKKEDEVIARVTKAEELCHHVTNNNNRIILEGRCMWTLGKLYRYLKNDTKAREYISNARSKLYNVAPGEDSALTNYDYSVILLDKVTPDGNPDSVFAEAETTLRITIHDAELGDYGLDVCHPKIRLAQLHLGSSTHRAGTARNAGNIDSVWSLLSELGTAAASMAVRTKCMYYYTMSDYHRNKSNQMEALIFAQKAFDIAMKMGFETEKSSIKIRLASMESHNHSI